MLGTKTPAVDALAVEFEEGFGRYDFVFAFVLLEDGVGGGLVEIVWRAIPFVGFFTPNVTGGAFEGPRAPFVIGTTAALLATEKVEGRPPIETLRGLLTPWSCNFPRAGGWRGVVSGGGFSFDLLLRLLGDTASVSVGTTVDVF